MAENDIEALADALFSLSDRLRVSGFLKDDANHAAYEKVVASFTALRSTTAEPNPAPAVAAEGELLPCPFCGGAASWIEDTGAFDEPFGLVTEHADTCHLACFLAEKDQIITAWNTRHPTDSAAKDAEIAELREALEEGRRAIGDHWAPNDCYATGPVTGDPIRDLVQCPACSFIAMYDKTLANRGEAGALAKERSE